MILKRLEIENFLSIGQGAIDFDNKGLVLIEGINNDSPSSISNGAGKSSVYDALFWCLYGKTKRPLESADKVVNNVAKKDCKVTLLFDDYRVIRTRAASTGDKNGLSLQVFDSSAGEWRDLTKGTMRDTQATLEETIKMSELTFLKLTSFGQGDVKPLASLTDAELKTVFEQALGLTFCAEYQEKIKNYRAERQREVDVKRLELSRLEGDLKSAEDRLTYIKQGAEAFEKARAENLASRDEEMRASQKELAALLKSIPDVPVLAERLKSLRAGVAKLGDLAAARRKLEAGIEAKKRDLYGKQHAIAAIRKDGEQLVEDVRKARERVGQPCRTCARPYGEEDIAPLVEGLTKTLVEKRDAFNVEGKAAEGVAQELEALAGLHAKLLAEIGAFEEQRVEISAVEAELKSAQTMLAQAKTMEERIGRIEEERRLIQGKANTYLAQTEVEAEKVIKIKLQIAELESSFAGAAEELDDLGLLEGVFGNAGLKSYLLDNVTPELNRLINQYLRILDDIEIEVSTMKALKTGDLREKIDIRVVNQHGADHYGGNSGGELRKIDLAIALGLNSLVRSLYKSTINAIFLDEPFESLDPGSSEKVIELCESFVDVGNVFLVTHNDSVKQLVANVITVEKTGRVAVIK